MKPSKDFITHVPCNRKPSGTLTIYYSPLTRVRPTRRRPGPRRRVVGSVLERHRVAFFVLEHRVVFVRLRRRRRAVSKRLRQQIGTRPRIPGRASSQESRRAFSHLKSSDAYAARFRHPARDVRVRRELASMNASPSRHGFCSRKLSRKSCVLVMRAAARVLSMPEPSAASGASVRWIPPGVLMEGATVSVWSITIHVAMYVIIVESMREACRSGWCPRTRRAGRTSRRRRRTHAASSRGARRACFGDETRRLTRRIGATRDAGPRTRRGCGTRDGRARARGLDIFDVLRRSARARSGVIGRCYVTPNDRKRTRRNLSSEIVDYSTKLWRSLERRGDGGGGPLEAAPHT